MTRTSSPRPNKQPHGHHVSSLDSLLTAADALDVGLEQHKQQQQFQDSSTSSLRLETTKPLVSSLPDSSSASPSTLKPVVYEPTIAPVSDPPLPTSSSLSEIPAELRENEKCISLRLNLYGTKPGNISVTVQEGILAVRGIRMLRCLTDSDTEDDDSSGKQPKVVLKSHRYSRRYRVNTKVVVIASIRGTLSNSGILTIQAAKKPCCVKYGWDNESREKENQISPLFRRHGAMFGDSHVVSPPNSVSSEMGDDTTSDAPLD